MDSVKVYLSTPWIFGGPLFLAQVQWVHALRFFNKGIHSIMDFLCQYKRDWVPQDSFKWQFKLSNVDKDTFNVVINVTPHNMLHKIRISSQRPWWIDCNWYFDTLSDGFHLKQNEMIQKILLGCNFFSNYEN